ncbi:MAG: PUR family DNA/RNA-binding protein [Bacteroidales bacterium]|nr:PUR family DNA/RNA-binding protein [Bacteroidales bacterium]
MYKDDFEKGRSQRFSRERRFDRPGRSDRAGRYDRGGRYDRYDRNDHDGEDIYSKPVKAGKRTYFFDVKTTRDKSDFYLTITESKRQNNADGSINFDKHKIFLYKEDFQKFADGLNEVVEYIKNECFHGEIPQRPESPAEDEDSYPYEATEEQGF